VRARLTAVVAMFACCLVATTACSPSSPSDDQRVINSKEYLALYKDVAANFPEHLPPGVVLPADPPPMEGDIGRGNAAAAAYFYWSCAWEDVYLNGTDPTTKSTAMAQLRKFPTTEWALTYWTDPDGVWPKLLDVAQLGDLTDLRQFYESDCIYYRQSEHPESE